MQIDIPDALFERLKKLSKDAAAASGEVEYWSWGNSDDVFQYGCQVGERDLAAEIINVYTEVSHG